MIVVRGHSPNVAYLRLLALATRDGWRKVDSRVGQCRDLGAVAVELDGGERTIFLAGRGWNPAFALVEAAWVICGRNDVGTLRQFVQNFDQYSDDGQTLQGAYGNRLRNFFGRDQVEIAINELSENPSSRRVILTLYAPSDLGLNSKDIPCNTEVALRSVEGRLEMTVFNRSNDLWLGVPYNWFVFRTLQHLVADRLGIPCGIQRHVSSCLHLYDIHLNAAKRVVACNSESALKLDEARLTGLDVQALLSDSSHLADLSFDKLSGPQLSAFFVRFQAYQCNQVAQHPHASQDVLAASLDRWYLERQRPKPDAVMEPLTYNPPTQIGQRVLHWVLDTPADTVAYRLAAASQVALPMLRDALRSDFDPALRVDFDNVAAGERASRRFVLELVLGTLDPELLRTTVGDRVRERLALVAASAGLATARLRPREASDTQLSLLFGALAT